MPLNILIGAQWGDEGKGKIIDILTCETKHVVKGQGSNNAGHTVLIGNEECKLHLIPTGILHPHTICYIGAGTVIDPEILIQEIEVLQSKGINLQGRLWISSCAHIIFPYHRTLDVLLEKKKGERFIGTTGRGIGPCYADKANRLGIRMGEFVRTDLFGKILKSVLPIKNEELTKLFGAEKIVYDDLYTKYSQFAESLKPFVNDVEGLINEAINKNENIIFEGTQGTFLDISLGTYPYVTSSNTTAGGICAGSGIGPTRIDHTLGIVKAYTTRVGNGPLPTEVLDDDNFINEDEARECGANSLRKRRIGWFDAVVVRTAVNYNGIDSIAVTKLDVLDSMSFIKICVGYQIHGIRIDYVPHLTDDLEKIIPIYETVPGWKTTTTHIDNYNDLPENAKNYIKRIETLCKAPVSMISIGPQKEKTIIIKNIFDSKSKFVCATTG